MNPLQPPGAQSTGTANVRKPRNRMGPVLPFTVVWYGEKGELARASFSDENSANTHVIAMLQINMLIGNIIAVEIRQPDGKVLSSHYGPRPQKRETAPCSATADDNRPGTLRVEAA